MRNAKNKYGYLVSNKAQAAHLALAMVTLMAVASFLSWGHRPVSGK